MQKNTTQKPTRTLKTSFNLSPEAKHRLTTLKADARLRGLDINESKIIEVLIGNASVESLAKSLRK